MRNLHVENIITELVERVVKNERHIGVLSTGEFLAVALVLDRKDLLGTYTMVEAANRVGPQWLEAALWVQRARS